VVVTFMTKLKFGNFLTDHHQYCYSTSLSVNLHVENSWAYKNYFFYKTDIVVLKMYS
jgi:hypothetical protein